MTVDHTSTTNTNTNMSTTSPAAKGREVLQLIITRECSPASIQQFHRILQGIHWEETDLTYDPERQMELWNQYETTFSVPGVAIGKQWFGLSQAMDSKSNSNNNTTNNHPSMSAAFRQALQQHGFLPVPNSTTTEQPKTIATPQSTKPPRPVNTTTATPPSASKASFSSARPTRLFSSPSADWSYKDIAPMTDNDNDDEYLINDDDEDDDDARSLPEPTTLYRESTLMSNVGEPLSPISSRGSRSSQQPPQQQQQQQTMVTHPGGNNNHNHHNIHLDPAFQHHNPNTFHHHNHHHHHPSAKVSSGHRIQAAAWNAQDQADPWNMQLPNGSWMSQEQITRLLLKVQPHVLMKLTSTDSNSQSEGYAFRGGLDLWAMLFFHDPATGPEELETFGCRLIARDILVNYTPHVQDLSQALLVLYPLKDPFVLNSLVRWKTMSSNRNDSLEIRVASTHTEETEAEDGMDVLMRLSRLMDNLCHEFTVTRFHEYEMACAQLQVLSMPTGSLTESAAFMLNLFNVITRHVALLVRHFPEDPRAKACAKIWPKDLASLHEQFFANVSYNIGGEIVTLASLQQFLYGTEDIAGFLEKKPNTEHTKVSAEAIESTDGLVTDGGSVKRRGGWMRRFLSSIFSSCTRGQETAVVVSNPLPKQETKAKSVASSDHQHHYYYKAPILKGNPKLLMACTWGMASSPTVSTVYPHKLGPGIDAAMRSYVQKTVHISLEAGYVTLPALLAWHAWDFASLQKTSDRGSGDGAEERQEQSPVAIQKKGTNNGPELPDADAILEHIMPFMSMDQLREIDGIKNSIGHLVVKFAADASFDWSPSRLGMLEDNAPSKNNNDKEEEDAPALIATPTSNTPSASPSSASLRNSSNSNDMDADVWSVAQGSVYTTPYTVVAPPESSAPIAGGGATGHTLDGLIRQDKGNAFQPTNMASQSPQISKPPTTNRFGTSALVAPPASLDRRVSSSQLATPPSSLKRPQTSMGDQAFNLPSRYAYPLQQIHYHQNDHPQYGAGEDCDNQTFVSEMTEDPFLRNASYKYWN